MHLEFLKVKMLQWNIAEYAVSSLLQDCAEDIFLQAFGNTLMSQVVTLEMTYIAITYDKDDSERRCIEIVSPNSTEW